MKYYVYLIKCTNTGVKKSYVGYTNNLQLRIKNHNTNKGAKSTKGYKWVLVYTKEFNNKSSAMSYEYQLKKNYYLRNKILKQNLNEKI